MDRIKNLFQIYRQAVWRTQRQWIGLVLILVVVTVMVAGLYLNVTARTALAGRSIQAIREQITENELTNADLETELASLTSTETMEQRVRALGFRPVESSELIYLNVQGYSPKPAFRPAANGQNPAADLLPPEYTESLLDWFTRILAVSPLDGVQK
jgi:cell division protein FtsL